MICLTAVRERYVTKKNKGYVERYHVPVYVNTANIQYITVVPPSDDDMAMTKVKGVAAPVTIIGMGGELEFHVAEEIKDLMHLVEDAPASDDPLAARIRRVLNEIDNGTYEGAIREIDRMLDDQFNDPVVIWVKNFGVEWVICAKDDPDAHEAHIQPRA